jgi:RNA polymerase sigma-70 factor (ECF subfamily)
MTGVEFNEAYGQHKDVLYRFARRMTGSGEVAEDVVHDCFMLVWRNRAMHRPERGTMRSFLIGVTRNLALKRLQRERPFDELEEASAACGPIDVAGMERGEMVSQAVAALPPF